MSREMFTLCVTACVYIFVLMSKLFLTGVIATVRLLLTFHPMGQLHKGRNVPLVHRPPAGDTKLALRAVS